MDHTERIRQIAAERLGTDPDRVQLHSRLVEDLGADSLDRVELLVTLEDELGIEVPDEVVEALNTVGDVVAFVEEHQAV